MSAIPSPERVEAALQRLVERPFLRRAPLDLPLLKASLKRAMVDEVKLVAPSHFLLAVPAEQFERLGPSLREWEAQLAEYYLEVVEENGWSRVDHPRIRIVADPDLRGNAVMVSVEEGYLVHHGRALGQRKRRRALGSFLASSAAVVASLYLVALLLLPGLVPAWAPAPGLPEGGRITAPALGRWWDGTRQAATRGLADGVQALGRAAGEAVPKRVTGEVVVSPGLTVRAGSPSRSGGVSPDGLLARGTVLHWWSFQVARGESIGGEDRWVEVGRAGPEWGDYQGQKLYVWMGGLQVR